MREAACGCSFCPGCALAVALGKYCGVCEHKAKMGDIRGGEGADVDAEADLEEVASRPAPNMSRTNKLVQNLCKVAPPAPPDPPFRNAVARGARVAPKATRVEIPECPSRESLRQAAAAKNAARKPRKRKRRS